MKYEYFMLIADIRIKITSPLPLGFLGSVLGKAKDTDAVDVIYNIVVIDHPLPDISSEHPIIYGEKGSAVFLYGEKEIRRFQVAHQRGVYNVYLHRPDVEKSVYDLYMSVQCIDAMKNSFRFINMFSIENVLLESGGIMLHSVVMEHKGQAILLTAPSGTGKTTHSNIWNKLYDIKILNGDKALIQKKNGAYHAYGSPYAGSSGLYLNEGAPIAAIAVLRQAKANKITPLSPFSAYSALYSECTVNNWSERYISLASDVISDMISSIPIYKLECNMDDDAAVLLRDTVFGKE